MGTYHVARIVRTADMRLIGARTKLAVISDAALAVADVDAPFLKEGVGDGVCGGHGHEGDGGKDDGGMHLEDW